MSQTAESTTTERQLQQEVERLRARLAALEAELVEVQAHANDAVAEWQERAYWLDRWHLDLNALMRRRGTARVRGLLRAVRAPLRLLRKASRAVRS
jgi:tetrahydrodipicolinate N-succinyltransferase